jgi:hypothetical protein
VSEDEIAEATRLSLEEVRLLQAGRSVRLHFDEQERPVIERAGPEGAQSPA